MEIGNKKCTACKEVKTLGDFYKQKSFKDGFTYFCKDCIKERRKDYYKKNREKCLKSMKDWGLRNKLKIRSANKIYWKQNKKKLSLQNKEWKKKNSKRHKIARHEYYLKNKEQISLENRKWNKKNKEYRARYAKKWAFENREWVKNYMNGRYQNDINFRIKVLLRSRLRKVISRDYKEMSVIDLVGCPVSELRYYIESQFEEGMSWKNWGNSGWHIDHIKPCAAFDLSVQKQQQECFHYTNLQPLWAEENLKKGAKVL